MLAIFWVYLAGVVTPGPNFIAVVHKAVATTRAEALALVAGIVTVNLFWCSCAITSLGIVFAAFPWAAMVVKVLGAVYLIWFGAHLVLYAGRLQARHADELPAGNLKTSFYQGIVTNICNPKAIVFYAAAFSAAAPHHVAVGTFACVLAVVMVVSLGWYGLVAVVLSHPRISSAYQDARKAIDRLSGGLILGLGIQHLI